LKTCHTQEKLSPTEKRANSTSLLENYYDFILLLLRDFPEDSLFVDET